VGTAKGGDGSLLRAESVSVLPVPRGFMTEHQGLLSETTRQKPHDGGDILYDRVFEDTWLYLI
jgi:hypothetical protein